MKNILLFIMIPFLLCGSVAWSSLEIKSIEGTDLLKAENLKIESKNKKGLVVIFLSARCPCSHSHISEIKKLFTDYPDFSFVAIHSNADENKEEAKPYFEKMNLPFSVIQDEKTHWADTLKAYKTPHAFIFKADGSIAYQGGVSSSRNCEKADRLYLREALEDLQAHKTVRTPEGRTLGCSIARGEQNEKNDK